MPEQPNLTAAIGLPPEQAINYFRSKGYQVTWDWHEMWQEAHAKAFTVAKAAKLDLLADIRGEVDKALAEGISLDDFQKRLMPKLKAKGWWGRDENGALLGSPHRMETIYRTNLQTAYMAGRYKEMAENTDDRPYWRYVAVLDSRTRPAHSALNGKVFRHDDVFWDTHYPPLGYRCRCRVRALTADQVKRGGYAVETGKGHMETKAVEVGGQKRTVTGWRDGSGMVRFTDPGWSYNPGKEWARWDAGGTNAIIKALPDQKTWKEYGRLDLRDVAEALRIAEPELLKAATTRAAAVEVLAEAVGVSVAKPLLVVDTPLEQVAIRYEWLGHMVEKEADQRERYANFLLPTLTDPFEVWLALYSDGTYRKRYVGVFTGKRDVLCVVRENKDGSLLWNVMQASGKLMNRQRIGTLLYGK